MLRTNRKRGAADQPTPRRAQDSSGFVVAELLELAAMATDVAGANARLALARLVTELLRNGHDRTIGQAIESARTLAIARILRGAVEAASERVVCYHNGSTIELSLFAIPIVTAFDEDVPASQFDAALSAFSAPKHLTHTMGRGPLELPLMVFAPKLFRLEELQAMPPSLVRRVCVSLGTAGGGRDVIAHPLLSQIASCKRSAAFLRYLIGQRRLPQPDCGGPNDVRLCAALQDVTKRAVERHLGLACHVQAMDMGFFHDALYSGMWRYQEQRLDQLARASRAQATKDSSLEARIAILGRTYAFELRVEFFADNGSVGGHAYRLSARPSEAASDCVARITRRLTTAGIRTQVLTEFMSDEPSFGTRSRRSFSPSMIAIPI